MRLGVCQERGLDTGEEPEKQITTKVRQEVRKMSALRRKEH
jgi:hypothetical protein